MRQRRARSFRNSAGEITVSMTIDSNAATENLSEEQAAIRALPKQVVGLYSFPKSGNTWIRQIVASALDIPPKMLHRYVTDMHYGKIMQHPYVYEGQRWYFYKSHHKHLVTEHMGQVIKNDKVIYIYRHPLDVFLSYVNFVSRNVEKKVSVPFQFEFDSVDDLTADQMDSLFSVFLLYGTITPQNRVFGGYFEHVMGALALRETGFPIHILRYEDLHASFNDSATRMFEFLGLPGIDPQRVFAEADRRTAKDGKFFWKRQVGNYRAYLSDAHVAKFWRMFGEQMRMLGYRPD
jgi:hypothetical protein